MNRVTLIGHVGGVPEIKELTNTKVAKFSLATSESYKKDGEKITETTWHNLIFWGKQCDTIREYVTKGSQLAVEGRIQVRQYKDKAEVTHWATEIVCDKFELLGKKEETPKGKQEVKSMSNVDDLPQRVQEQQEVSEMDEMPF
jgi:single-strand DNA-binding protein